MLPLDDGAFDAAWCCVGAQYLQQPVSVFAEGRRIIVAGAPFVVSFSNCYFPFSPVFAISSARGNLSSAIGIMVKLTDIAVAEAPARLPAGQASGSVMSTPRTRLAMAASVVLRTRSI